MNRFMFAFLAVLFNLNLQPLDAVAQERTENILADFDTVLVNNLGRTWTIESVGTTDGITRIVTGLDELTEARYRVMVGLLCRDLSINPHVVSKLKEIVVLNKQENQGYVFEKIGSYQTVLKNYGQKQKTAIMKNSRIFKKPE